MKITFSRYRHAALLTSAAVFLAMPAFAQDAAPVAPPPVRATLPSTAPAQAPAATSAEAQPAAAAPAATRLIDPAAQAAADAERASRAPRAISPAARRPAPVQARAAIPRVSAPAPAEPVATVPAEPVAAAPSPAALPSTATSPAPVVETPAVTANDTTADTTTEAPARAPIWPWILGAIVVIGAIAAFALLRRRRDTFAGQYEPDTSYVYQPVALAVAEPALAEPVILPVAVPAPEPLAASPDEAHVVAAEADEVAALTDAAAPVGDRPWLEFAMRPVRAGTNSDEAVVEIELTIANSGNLPARDVRVSTFMLTDPNASDMERLLVDPPADATVDPVTIEPGEGARIDATLAALRADLGDATGFTPVVIADARYRLPDGSEGRTSASFVIGLSDGGGGIAPFALDERAMHDDVEARLHGEPHRV